MSQDDPLFPLPLPPGVTASYIDCKQTVGLRFHILQSGIPSGGHQKPLLLLVHGFPEMAFSWRKVLPALADLRHTKLAPEGYHVVAYDQRGYGRTTGWEADMPRLGQSLQGTTFTVMQLVRDAVALVAALGYTRVRCIVGHDFGGVTAGWCALVRDDLFESCVLMSHPWKGTPALSLPPSTSDEGKPQHDPDIQAALATQRPPRKHYIWYSATPAAAEDWMHPQLAFSDLPGFLRAYFYVKSAGWGENSRAGPLASWTASALAEMPEYYVMPQQSSMPQAVAAMLRRTPGSDMGLNETKSWLSDEDLAVYAQEWARTGFRGGLAWYASVTDPSVNSKDAELFAGKKIGVPVAFVSGKQDWGNWQEPGSLEGMELGRSCERYWRTRLIDGAGHWVQQEKPERVVEEVGELLGGLGGLLQD